MFTKKMPATRFYDSFADDFVESSDQEYELPRDYQWLRDKPWQKIASFLTTFALAKVLAAGYRLLYHVRIKNKQVLKAYRKQSYYLYGNHTQPQGDAFMPFHVITGRKFATIVSPANLGIPILGKLLPYAGVIPTPSDKDQMKAFLTTLKIRAQEPVLIYPEEHVWPYYTEIRPLSLTAFHYPAARNAAVFCMTTTYQKRHFSKRPKQTIYVDGPFLAPSDLSLRERQRYLQEVVAKQMKARAKQSTYAYISYERRNG